MVAVFFHVACMGNHWYEVVDEIISRMVQSRLYNTADLICVAVSGKEDDYNKLKNALSPLDRLSLHFNGDVIGNYEFPTLKLLAEFCAKQPEAKVLYCHSKGVSKNYYQPFWKYWRQYMAQSCITEYGKHIDALETNDVSGDMWTDNTHFSGNFWWANASYINKLPNLNYLINNPRLIYHLHTKEENLRINCEMWIGMHKGIKVKENGILNMKPGFAWRIVGKTDKVPCPLNEMNFDRKYLINLDERKDRWAKSKCEIDKVGLTDVIRFPAIDARTLGITKKALDNPGLVGCFLSHFFILQEAVMHGYKRVLIMEDDVTFVNGFNELLNYTLSQVPDNWELMYLGYTDRKGLNGYKQRLSDSITVPGDIWGTQAYMVQNNGIKILYDNLKSIKDHIDIQMSRHISNKINVYAAYPSLCPQAESLSDIAVGTIKFKMPKRRGHFTTLT